MAWKLKLVNCIGEIIAEELSNKEEITTKDIGELGWILYDGDTLVLEKVE